MGSYCGKIDRFAGGLYGGAAVEVLALRDRPAGLSDRFGNSARRGDVVKVSLLGRGDTVSPPGLIRDSKSG